MASYAHRADRPNRPHTCVYRGPDGRQKRESFRTKSEARAAVARRTVDEERWKREGPGEHLAAAGPVPTLGEWAEEWMAQYNRAFATRRKRRSALDRWILPELSSRPLDDVGPMDVMRLLVSTRRGTRAATTEDAVYTALYLMFDFAVRMGVIRTSPLAVIDRPKGAHRRARTPVPLTDDEFEKLVAEMHAPYDVMAMAMFYGGLRPSEACGLEARHVVGRWLVVEQAVKADRTVGPTKTSTSRRVPIGAKLASAFEPYLATTGPMFPEPRDGQWMAERRFREAGWERAAKSVGLADRTPYDLRHSAASRLLARGATIRQVQAFMGHADLKTTQIYLHLFPGDLDALGELLD